MCWQEDAIDEAGAYVVSSYRDVEALFHDPRLSSDERKNQQTGGRPLDPAAPLKFLNVDPPEHDRLRALAMRHFGPPERPAYLVGLRPEIERIVSTLLDKLQGVRRFDFVERFSYPLPVAVICRILGVPPEDEPQFSVWASAIAQNLETTTEKARRVRDEAGNALVAYIGRLVERHRKQPGDDLLSRMSTDDGPQGRMTDAELAATGDLLLVAGHETTVNLLGNGLLTLLRKPDVLDRLRSQPELMPTAVEEMLRLEPPVQFIRRTALDDLDVAGTTIRKGKLVVLAIAAANRDPERRDNQHLGFGSGIHACFGAPLARTEGQIAFSHLLERLEQPRLVVDPPPYRPSPLLRGPEHLHLEVARLRATAKPVARAA